ncbi:MAG: helix-turn-helix transcriptional regulator [Acidimicrobiia bacterium]|nr:helix-turn-helix transcriptional regulator [Acidimicrobiia bacterium]MDH5238710.1 helix-turn-helix transcriptional regulator [Acidimicrobiia bacterium]
MNHAALESGVPGSSIARTLDLIGDRWTLLVLRAVFRGRHRFTELQRDLGIARNLLTDRLHRLVDNGILERVPYQERPVRHEYRLTDMGRDLSPALIAFMQWGDRWCTDGPPPTVLVHDACGTPIEHTVRCPSCDDVLDPREIASRDNG